ncbi:unnamed protein product [Rhodiola kirilowii]
MLRDYSTQASSPFTLLSSVMRIEVLVLLFVDPLLTIPSYMLGSALITWKTKKQAVVFRSSTEYRAMSQTPCELVWLTRLLAGLQVVVHCPILSRGPENHRLFLGLPCDQIFHERMKHVSLD